MTTPCPCARGAARILLVLAAAGAILPGAARTASASGPAGDPTALKILVGSDGPVAVSGAQLAAAGWDLAHTRRERLALSSNGQPHAFELAGPAVGPMTPADRLVFVGQALQGPYTRINVYWLTRSGPGQRFGSRSVTPTRGLPLARWFVDTAHLEGDTSYDPYVRAETGEDRWLWGDAIPPGGTWRATFSLRDPFGDAPPGRLSVRFFVGAPAHGPSPDQRLRLRLDDHDLGEARLGRPGGHLWRAVLPACRLLGPDHVLEIASPAGSGPHAGRVAVDWFELDYPAGYAAAGDRLDFRPPAAGRHAYRLTGFASADVVVLDVTDPAAPVRLTGVDVRPESDGTHVAAFADDAGPEARLLAYAPGALAPPEGVVPNAASDWAGDHHGADYIAISHPDFAAALAPLLAHRRAQGLRALLVLVDDVYDEFSHGVLDPRAIRSFLRHADRAWREPSPTYVLLVGESSLDYHGAYTSPAQNRVPTMQVEIAHSGSLGVVASDHWFANLRGADDDPVPEVLLGRFPVSTVAQAHALVTKTLLFEAEARRSPWRRSVTLVADDGADGAFETLADELAVALGPAARVQRFRAASHPRHRDLSADIRAAIEDGTRLVTFVGHGNVELWSPWPGGGPILRNADIARLGNRDRLPLLVSSACMNGWIDHPIQTVALAEMWLVHPTGGGVAAWAPSGTTSLRAVRPLLLHLHAHLFGRPSVTLGRLVADAMAPAALLGPEQAEAARMFVLLGDPALTLADDPPPVPALAWLPVALAPHRPARGP